MVLEAHIPYIVLGSVGGFVRALVGIGKELKTTEKVTEVRLIYFSFTLFSGIVIGGFSGAFATADPKLALLVGYAGSDFLEALYKIKTGM